VSLGLKFMFFAWLTPLRASTQPSLRTSLSPDFSLLLQSEGPKGDSEPGSGPPTEVQRGPAVGGQMLGKKLEGSWERRSLRPGPPMHQCFNHLIAGSFFSLLPGFLSNGFA
jgi:hypothetical protein